ncbi:MAG TPA: BatD family protein, partial [Rubricoccaceae bacterium]
MTRRLAPRAAARPLAALLIALTLGVAGPAAAQTRASVRVSPTRVAVGGRVAYTLTLRGAPGRAFPTPPATAGLRAVQASPTSDATLQVNGDIQRELTWTFEAVRPGPARIGPFRVDLGGGRELSIQAASVTVTGSASPNPQAARGRAAPPTARAPGERADLFARIELSAERVVVGQQVVAEVVLYFDPDLQPRQTLAAGSWDAPGFWREELDVASTVPHPVTLGGRAFEAVTLARLALFPTRAGRLMLPPMRFAVDFLRVDPFGIDPNDPFAPFFAPFSGGLEEVEVEAPATSLDVTALPPGAPAGFSGAVGQFTMQAAPVSQAASVGEPVVVEITVAGTGNVATLGAPALATPRGADAFPPRDEADIDRTGDRVRGRRTFRYTLVPQVPGSLDVPPAVWTFFDPETGIYQTLGTDSTRVAVSGVAVPASGPSPAGPAADLIAEASWSRRGLPVGVLWGVLGTGLALPAVALGAVAAVRSRRRAATADTPENRRRHALARAEARLAEIRAAAEARTLAGPDACAAAERAVHAFLSDRFGIASAGLDRTALAAALDAAAVPGAARVLAVLAALDVGQFAPALAR